MRRRNGWIALAAAATLALGLLFGLPGAVRLIAEQRAAQRGLSAQIRDVSFELTGATRLSVWLESLEVSHPEVPQVKAELPFLEVQLGLSGVRAIIAHGGRVSVTGSTDALRNAIRTARGEPTSDGGGAARSKTKLELRGLTVAYVPSLDESYHLWGFTVLRRSGSMEASVDLARLQYRGVSVQSRHLRAELLTPALQLRSLSAVSTEADVDLARLVSRAAPTPQAPAAKDSDSLVSATAPSVAPSEPPGDAVPSDATAPSKSPLLALFSLRPGRGERIRQQLKRASGLLAGRLPENALVDLAGFQVRLSYAGSHLNLGPGHLKLGQDAQAVFGSFVPETEGQAGAEGVEFSFRSPLSTGPFALKLAGGPIYLSQLGVQNSDFGLTHVDRAKLRLSTDLSLSDDGKQVEYSSNGELQHLSLYNARIAPEPLRDLSLRWKGSGEMLTDGSRILLRDGTLSLGDITVHLQADVLREPERLMLNAGAEIPQASCQSMFDSLPSALVGELARTQFSGMFSWKAGLVFDSDNLAEMKTSWHMQNGCRVERVPTEASASRFRGAFARYVPGAGNELTEIISGPGSADWVPLAHISRHLEIAVTVTEDGRFWSHKGFDPRAIESAIQQNLRSGKFVRGASTISMQLAKNLYLSRDKHIARKLREAWLTMLLEQEFRKDEILELYFNVIEFGPGIYGIGPAAWHYFRSEPFDLSIKQAFYLASLLPNPKNSHFGEDGTLNPGWDRYLQRLIRIAHGREKLSDEELEEALTQSVAFGQPHLRPGPYLPGSGLPGEPPLGLPF